MTAGGVLAWTDLDNDGVATATLNPSGGGGTPDDNSVTTTKIADGAILNADVNSAAAIAYSKLALTGGIVDADINAAAAIANTKLATNPLARANHTGTQTMSTISDAGTLATKSAVASADITDGTIVNADISTSAAVAVAKLAAGTATYVLTSTAGTAVWSPPSGGGALTTASNILGTDVPMGTAGTFYDGPAVTCASGTWLLMGKVHILAGSTAVRTYTTKLWDGTASYAVNIEAVTGTGTAANFGMPVSMIVTPSVSTQYKISVTSTVNTDTLKGTAVSLLSYLHAVKVA